MAILRRKNPEKYKEDSYRRHLKYRNRILDRYGRKCVRCGFEDVRALSLHHCNNNGADERRKLGKRGVYIRAMLDEHRNDYQILCMNCQYIKRVEEKVAFCHSNRKIE